MVLPVKELPHFEGTKREDVITFIRHVDEIAQGAGWTDKEWVLTMADLLGGRVAPLARWIRTGLSVGQPIDQEVVVHHLLEAYGDGQTSYAAYQRLEQCRQQGNEKVFEFKIRLEELFWTLEDEPSELAKTAKFVSGLLPSLNKKLRGKEYSSLAHAVEAAQIEERRLGEAEKCTHGEDWEQQKKHGRGREWSRERSWTKWQAEKEQAKEKEQGSPGEDSKPKVWHEKGFWQCGKEGHMQLSAQSGEGQLSLFSVSTMTTRGNFGQNLAKPSECYPQLYGRLLTSRFWRPIKETRRRSWW